MFFLQFNNSAEQLLVKYKVKTDLKVAEKF
jgi:hypothetical protein